MKRDAKTKKRRPTAPGKGVTIGEMLDALFIVVQANDKAIQILDRRVKALHRSLKKGLRP